MRKIILLPTMLLLTLLTFSCSTDPLNDETIDRSIPDFAPEAKTIEIKILELINQHRLSIGLNSLVNMIEIKAETYRHTNYMIENNRLSHDNIFVRKENLESSIGAIRMSENLAFGYTNAESLMNGWLSSPGHRDTIEGDFIATDISAKQDENGNWYYTSIFVRK